MITITITRDNLDINISVPDDTHCHEMMDIFVGAMVTLGYQHLNIEEWIVDTYNTID